MWEKLSVITMSHDIDMLPTSFRTLLLFSFWKNSRKLFGYTSSAGASTQKYKYVSSLENKFKKIEFSQSTSSKQ